jgi:uncharacterized membrane protein YgdD (TMEM256/DUF423 family)
VRIWLIIAALNGALAVIAGAFAAHGLQGHLAPTMFEVFQTGARYHLTHALAMGLAAMAARGEAAPRARVSAMLFFAGIVLFSGSLYLLALTGLRGFGLVTPFGGLALIAGWITLALAGLKLKT